MICLAEDFIFSQRMRMMHARKKIKENGNRASGYQYSKGNAGESQKMNMKQIAQVELLLKAC